MGNESNNKAADLVSSMLSLVRVTGPVVSDIIDVIKAHQACPPVVEDVLDVVQGAIRGATDTVGWDALLALLQERTAALNKDLGGFSRQNWH